MALARWSPLTRIPPRHLLSPFRVRSAACVRFSSASTQHSPSLSPTHLAAALRSSRDVQDLQLLSLVGTAPVPVGGVRPLVLVKIGGDIITQSLPALAASLRHLAACGLAPVVVHGGGPQLNAELARMGVEPEYIGGE